MSTTFEQVQECVEAIRAQANGLEPKVAVILGSGLGGFADALAGAISIPYEKLPRFPRSSVPGHAGRLVLGTLDGQPLMVMSGRVHFYEGYTPSQVAFPARVMCALKPKALVVTNAAGGINPGFSPGDLMAITDHLNLSGFNSLVGPNEEALGPRFPDLSHAYAPQLLQLLEAAAKAEQVALKKGIYAQLSGPSYETPAEIRMLRTLGADAVGMSTVPEVVAAAHMGVKVAGISCITNLAAGISSQPLSHAEVSETAERVKGVFTRLLRRFVVAVALGA